MKKLPLLAGLFVLLNTLNLHSQVTVGVSEKPVPGALFQLKTVKDATSNGDINATKGFAFPRVALVKKDQLQPMYSGSEAAELTEAVKNAHKGLVVYNVAPVDNENLALGLNIWDGEQWTAISETQSRAQITFDCTKVGIYGSYYRHAPLTSSNYIILPITVEKKGDYTIIASTDNGYYFQASGIFTAPGSYEVRLSAMGTPAEKGTNNVSFTNNGIPIEPVCNNVSINVGVEVLTYRINNCESIKVYGDYWARRDVDVSHYVEIPVEVITPGTTQWETNMVNGIKFVANQTFNVKGETLLIIKAQGYPKQSGRYTYNIVTDGAIKNYCSFNVSFSSSLGTYSDPACNCLSIYDERPDVTNGEFFLRNCSGTTGDIIKTYCDISNGGYTLIWSVSEKAVYNDATFGDGMVFGANYRFSENRPNRTLNDEKAVINYSNYRLSNAEMQSFSTAPAGKQPTLKVRICEEPKNMNDDWGLNNYGILMPRSNSENPFITGTITTVRSVATGKVFGKRWEQKATGGGDGGGWDEVSGNRLIYLYSNASYPTHWDWSYLGSATPFEVVPNRGGSNNQSRMTAFNNTFGWFGEDGPNHHWGKCGGASASDFDFTTKTCTGTTLRPHSFNNGEGRYLQWFVR